MSFRLAGTRNVIKRISLFKSFFFDGKTPKLKQKTQTVVFLRPEKKKILKKIASPTTNSPPDSPPGKQLPDSKLLQEIQENSVTLDDGDLVVQNRWNPQHCSKKKGNQGMKLGDD